MQGIKNLTQGPINRQLFNLAMPIMATSFIQMAYSLTDMAWVGRLGSEAVAAIGSVGILTWMSGSISLLNKVGSEVSVGQSIGAQSQEDARSFASHNITIALIISICWGTLLFIFAEPIIRIYELEDHITANAIQYLRIVSTGLPFVFLSAAFTGIYNAAGRSKVPFFISGTGLILNIILDPLFIFGFGLGTNGAAYATCPPYNYLNHFLPFDKNSFQRSQYSILIIRNKLHPFYVLFFYNYFFLLQPIQFYLVFLI